MKVLDTAEVAELLKVRPVTVRRWLASGAMMGAKIPGAGWRITPEDSDFSTATGRNGRNPPMTDYDRIVEHPKRRLKGHSPNSWPNTATFPLSGPWPGFTEEAQHDHT